MKLPFLTTSKFSFRTLKALGVPYLTGGSVSRTWNENVSDDEDKYKRVFDKVRDILEQKGETVLGIAGLRYIDNGFDNKMYRIDGSKRAYFLKILGSKQGNRREVFVWRVLGYEKDGKRQPSPWIPGLPGEVFALDQLNSVLTPYFPGQLRMIPSGVYEFPLVMTLVWRLYQTLTKLHEFGLVYMDLCPENIMLLQRKRTSPVTFFLTDMGSAKIVSGHHGEGADWHALRGSITGDNLTRSETRPPKGRFWPESGSEREMNPGYDFHTLARTARILLGLGSEDAFPPSMMLAFPKDFNLENPLEPRHSEIKSFMEILGELKEGRRLPTQELYTLFQNFFSKRATFIGEFIDDEALRGHCARLLTLRLKWYKAVLTPEDRQQIENDLDKTKRTEVIHGLSRDFEFLKSLPEKLRDHEFEDVISRLERLQSSKLLEVSSTARYSFDYHRKILKVMAGQDEKVKAYFLKNPRMDSLTSLGHLPEKETLLSLRKRHNPDLGLLNRPFIDN